MGEELIVLAWLLEELHKLLAHHARVLCVNAVYVRILEYFTQTWAYVQLFLQANYFLEIVFSH
jgi:hypothetical protein